MGFHKWSEQEHIVYLGRANGKPMTVVKKSKHFGSCEERYVWLDKNDGSQARLLFSEPECFKPASDQMNLDKLAAIDVRGDGEIHLTFEGSRSRRTLIFDTPEEEVLFLKFIRRFHHASVRRGKRVRDHRKTSDVTNRPGILGG